MFSIGTELKALCCRRPFAMEPEMCLCNLATWSHWIRVDRQVKGVVLLTGVVFSCVLCFVLVLQPSIQLSKKHSLTFQPAHGRPITVSQHPISESSSLSSATIAHTSVLPPLSTTIDYKSMSPHGPAIDNSTEALNDTDSDPSAGYVSLCKKNFDGRRLGNQLFNFAAMVHVARLTGRRPAMVRRHPDGWIDRWFEVAIHRVEDIDRDLSPRTVIGDEQALVYESTASALRNWTRSTSDHNTTLLVCGWTQSWRYTVGVERQLRERHLRPRPRLADSVRLYLERVRPGRWSSDTSSFARVGIHVRVGDLANLNQLFKGYTVPGRHYFEHAMRNMVDDVQLTGGSDASVDGRRHVQFIVVSDSIEWCRSTMNLSSIADELRSPYVDVDLVYSDGNYSAGFDMVTLTLCDALIITTGTYGWWAAWLADKKTIYYDNWPRPGSPLAMYVDRAEFFPKHWISMGGPYAMFQQDQTF